MASRRAFLAIALSQTLSMLGSRMSGVAVGFAVYAATGDAAPLLLFSFFQELPAMLFGTLAGALVDRGDPRRAAVLADAGQALASGFLAFAFVGGFFSPAILYAVGLVQGLCAMFQGPAKDLVVAELVPDEGRDRANSLLAAGHPAAGILAPALAGALFPLVGVGGVVLVDLATFLVAVAALLRFAPRRAPTSPDGAGAGKRGGGLLAELGETLAYLFVRAPLLGLLVLYSAFLNFCLNGPLELALPYAVERLGGPGEAGAALSFQGLGGLLGGIFLAARGRVGSRFLSILLGMLGAGGLMLALALSRSGIALAASLFGVVACLQVWSRFTSIYLAEAPERLRGKVLAFAGQLGFLGSTSSFALAGFLADRVLGPLAESPAWSEGAGRGLAAVLFGSGRGAGMALIIAAAGAAIVVSSLGMALVPGLRRIGNRGTGSGGAPDAAEPLSTPSG